MLGPGVIGWCCQYAPRNGCLTWLGHRRKERRQVGRAESTRKPPDHTGNRAGWDETRPALGGQELLTHVDKREAHCSRARCAPLELRPKLTRIKGMCKSRRWISMAK